MTLEHTMHRMALRARAASQALSTVPVALRNRVLKEAAGLLLKNRKPIVLANRRDLAAAEKAGLDPVLIERLTLTDKRIEGMARGLKEVAAQEDPVGAVESNQKRPSGITVRKVRVPIGAILIIYESRPNVTIDSAGLCLKAGNAVILRGGKEALHSNRVLARLFCRALKETGLPVHAVQLVDTTDRQAVLHLLRESDNLDLAIPRGGEGLIRTVMEHSRIPVLKHYKGICHVYIDAAADAAMAERIAVNAKVQRPGVCNAMETLLFDRALKPAVAVRVLKALQRNGVTLIGCADTRRLLPGVGIAALADYHTEYLDLKLSVKVVDGVKGAVTHIRRYGSAHTDAIVTQNRKNAETFLGAVDSASVMWNASTRFSDGGEYGLGAEIGISTDKIHARGPMGAHDLTTYKWVVLGQGHIRS